MVWYGEVRAVLRTLMGEAGPGYTGVTEAGPGYTGVGGGNCVSGGVGE